jgi:hypothetical protein
MKKVNKKINKNVKPVKQQGFNKKLVPIVVVGIVLVLAVILFGTLYSGKTMAGQAVKTKTGISVYDAMKTEFANQGLSEDEMITRFARSDIIYSDIMAGIHKKKLSTGEDVNFIYPAVQYVNVNKKIKELNSKGKLSSAETKKLKTYVTQATNYKKDIAKSLSKIYVDTNALNVKNTAYLVSNEDFYKSQMGVSLDSLALQIMPFGPNLEGLIKGKGGSGGPEGGSGGGGDMPELPKGTTTDSSNTEVSFSECVSGKLKGTGSAPGTPGGANTAGGGSTGMSGEAGGTGTQKGGQGGMPDFGGGKEGYGTGSSQSGVDMSNLCGGQAGQEGAGDTDGSAGDTGGNTNKDPSGSLNDGYDKGWVVQGTHNADQTSDKTITKVSCSYDSKTQEQVIKTTTITYDSSGEMTITSEQTRATGVSPKENGLDLIETQGNIGSNPFYDTVGLDSNSKQWLKSKGLNPESESGNCGQSVADCFGDKGSKMGCTGSDMNKFNSLGGTDSSQVSETTSYSSETTKGSSSSVPAGGSGWDVEGMKQECGCLSMALMGGSSGVQATPIDMPQDTMFSGCGKDKGKALELAQLGTFFTDPSPLMAMMKSGTEASTAMQEGFVTTQGAADKASTSATSKTSSVQAGAVSSANTASQSVGGKQ